MKTRTELIHQTLRNLGVLPVGEAPDADTYTVVDDLIDGLIAELEARDIVDIQNVTISSVEEKYYLPLARILAWRAAPAFGAQNDQFLMQLGTESLAVLDEMDRIDVHWTGKHSRTMRSDYPVGCSILNASTLF